MTAGAAIATDAGSGSVADSRADPAAPEPRDVSLLCVGRRSEAPDVLTLFFTVADGGAIAHVPGQAVTLAIPVPGETLHRTFTISGASPARETIAVTVKAHPHGRATRWLHAHAAPGLALSARGPHGTFTLGRRRGGGAGVAFVSAGSGATPMIAMLRALAEDAPQTEAAWIHVARTPEDALFGEEVARLQAIMPRLEARVIVSRPGPGWFGFAGRVSRRLMSVAAPDLARREVFLCGPEGFMDAVRLIHAAEGGDPARLHTERFAPPAAPAGNFVEDAPAPASHASCTVTLGGKAFAAAPGETLMEAAARQGVVVPRGCGQGLCGTCRMRLLDGAVAMRHNGGLSVREEAEGLILACSARPTSDVTLAF